MTAIAQPIEAPSPRSLGATYAGIATLIALALAGITLRFLVFAWLKGETDLNGYVHALCVWDCGWYRTIAEGGYDLAPGIRLRPGAANWAFFPLSPTLAALLGRLTGLSAEWAGFIVSNTATILAVLAARPLFNNARAYWLFATGLLVGPFSFLFSSLHTEALFILMTTLALRALGNSRFVLAGMATALLSATRVTGVLMVFAMLARAIEDHLRQGGRWRDLPRALIGNPPLLLGLALAPTGLFAYIAWLRFQVGDGLAFVHIQRAWGRELVNPLSSLAVLTNLDWPLTPAGMVVATWTVAAVIGLLLSVVLLFQRRAPAAIFCALCILVSLSAGQTSMVRFVAGLAPLGWALSELLARWTPAWVLAFPIAVILDVVLTIGWMNSSMFVM